jgi:hypothetical protein
VTVSGAPAIDALLSLGATAVRPGEELSYSIRNIGGTPIQFGGDYMLERRADDGEWVVCPNPMWVAAFGCVLRPGDARQLSARIPADAPPGRYRLGKQVSYLWSLSPEHRRDHGARVPKLLLSFEFDLL